MNGKKALILAIACSAIVCVNVVIGAVFVGPVVGGVIGTILILIVIVGLLLFKLTENGGYGVSANDRRKAFIKSILPDRTEEIEKIIRKSDKGFSEVKFKAFAEYVYVTLEEAICNRSIPRVRMFLHDDFYKYIKNDIDTKYKNHIIRVSKNNDVSDVYITSYIRDDRFERAFVCLYVLNISYEMNELNKQVINGDPRHKCGAGYLLEFVRNKGVKTSEINGEPQARNCPNCGAPVEDTGKCDYCGSVLTTGAYSWVLVSIRPVEGNVTDYGIVIPGEKR